MAFEFEDIMKTISAGADGQAFDPKKAAEAILAMHAEDVKGLKATNEELKKEKTDEITKHKADADKFAEAEKKYQADLKAVQDKLAGGDTDLKKVFDTQVEQLNQSYQLQLNERDKSIAEQKSQIESLLHKDMVRDQEAEFMKEVSKTKADPATYEIIKMMVLGPSGDKFTTMDSPTGRIFVAADKSGKTIGNCVTDFMNSDAGKRFVTFKSSGAGAEGSASTGDWNGENPFESENISKQMELFRTDRATYNLLKKQYEAKHHN